MLDGRPGASRQVIVNFHGVGPAPGRGFDSGEQAYWLDTDTYRAAIGRIAEARDAGFEVAITFDDGNASDLEIAAPILAEHGLSATFFVLAGRLGAPDALSVSDLAELCRMGMGIGSHGADHVDWRRLDEAGAERELDWARAQIAAATGGPVTTAAIPFGAYDGTVLRRLRQAGYQTAYTSDGGLANGRAFLQPRTSLRRDTGAEGLEHILAGRMPLRRRLRRAAAMFVKRHV